MRWKWYGKRNATEVKPGERLSDHVYEYDAEERSIVRADKVEERRQTAMRSAYPLRKLPEMKEKAAEQTKVNSISENAKKKAQEIA